MLGKLMKYEFIAMGRIFLPMFGALIIISIVNAILGRLGLTTPQVIAIVVSVLIIVGILIIVYVLTIQRFWTNLMSNEGYLMMTLPVSVDKLILSKLFVATIWSIISTIVVIVAVIIMASAEVNIIRELVEFGIFSQIPLAGHEIALLLFGTAVMAIIASFANILLIYACMALGMMVNKYRILVAVGSYIAITTIMQIVATVTIFLISALGGLEAIDRWANNLTTYGGMNAMIWMITGISLVLCAVFYLVTRFMMSRRLNLQ